MSVRSARNIIILLILGLFIVVIVVMYSTKWKPLQVPYPLPSEKERFLKYIMCSMAMCSGKAENNGTCENICISEEVLSVGIVDKDGKGNEITCREICENISKGNCLNKMCGKDYSINFTFNEVVTISQMDILEWRPFGRVMHWCCDYREEGWGWHYPLYYYRGRGGILYIPTQISEQYCENIDSPYIECTFQKGTNITFYAFPDENILSYWNLFKMEICTHIYPTIYPAIKHICASINVTNVRS